MKLPNIHFQDFPIDFKQIDPDDFPNLNTGKKVIISPNEDGYIDVPLQKNIDVTVKNTVVINAAVGQGKTTSIIRIIKKLYEDKNEDYLIFVASPFVSLVEQYYNKIVEEGIPKSQVYRYENIGNKPNIKYSNKKVQIITVNGILGNPGDDAFINSEAKRKYLDDLVRHCASSHKKVIFIYDEIHDAIHNFKEEYIFNLWKWRDVIHKNFILSATYNEASKVVIEYLAELTDDKIKIIESERIKIPKNQSELYLHYNPARYYRNENDNIARVVSDIISRGKEIDILCYSKNLAESIIKEKHNGVGGLLYEKNDELNNCTSELKYNQRLDKLDIQNRYDNTKCNVGTNFKTGVSIEKKNHAFLIILPPYSSRLAFKNSSGIFSGGVNSIIQALARQRKRGGEIHLIIPPPDEFEYTTLPFKKNKNQFNAFVNFYEGIKSKIKTSNKVLYIPSRLQNMLIYDFYEDKLKKNIESEIIAVEKAKREEDKLSLKFPDFKSYVLNHGEEYLANTFKFTGGDLSAFVTYSAITNQFINCNLKGFTANSTFTFEEGKKQILLELYLEYYVSEDMYHAYKGGNDFYFYLDFKNDFFKYQIKLKTDKKTISIKPFRNSIVESHILGFVQQYLYPKSVFTKSRFYPNGILVDYMYQRKDYFLSCISHVSEFDLENDLRGINPNRVKSFVSLSYFRNKLIENIKISSSAGKGEFKYLPKTAFSNFVLDSEVERFEEMLDYFINEDYFIKNNIFNFNQSRFNSKYTIKQKVKSFYTIILKDFFDMEDYKLSTGTRQNVKILNSTHPIPNTIEVLDLISPAQSKFTDETFNNRTYKVVDGVLIEE